MCGLTLVLRLASDPNSDAGALTRAQCAAAAARGPDAHGVYATRIPTPHGDALLVLGASVLGLRGERTAQPLVGKRGVLGWNGQVFSGLGFGTGEGGGDDGESEGEQSLGDDNDTRRIFARLEAGEDVDSVLNEIEGPYAFIYYQFATRQVHFALDPLSRRSLLVHAGSTLVLSSSRSAEARLAGVLMRALDGGARGVIDLAKLGGSGEPDFSTALHFHPPRRPLVPIRADLPPMDVDADADAVAAEVPRFLAQLTAAVRRRVDNIPFRTPTSTPNATPNPNSDPNPDTDTHPQPTRTLAPARVALLFSGGVDCTLLAYLVHTCVPPGEPIELVNVAFASPTAGAGGRGKAKPKAGNARTGTTKAGKAGKTEDGKEDKTDAPRTAETDATQSTTDPNKPQLYLVPDRLSGLAATAELRAACPGREFRFVEVDVDAEESKAYRQAVLDLMYPSVTEMDLSLAYPLFFASCGVGTLETAEGRVAYTVTAKVYVSGLGADEQLAGYTRHRKAFERGSWAGLVDEVQMDIDRLPQRNLSRDDRILSSHARDARYPYLDLGFVSYLGALPIWAKCNPALPAGAGDKRLIRLAARACGLPEAGGRVKRAMQFGTRSSKLSDTVKGYRAGDGLVREYAGEREGITTHA